MGLFDFLKKSKKNEIFSPVRGEIVSIENVPDEVFSTKMLGDGIAVVANENDVYAPADGVIENMFDTKHAFTIVTEGKAEILVHIGIDTVNLKGDGFEFLVNTGDTVKAGQKIGTVDFNKVKEAGYKIHTMVLVTNGDEFKNIVKTKLNNVKESDVILELEK